MKELIYIKIKDMCYYDDNFEYDTILVEKCDDFEEKMKQLEEICKNYDDFQQVEDFISDNFYKIDYQIREIYV